ncbi:MAG: hypothetical protein JJU34_07690 [Lunatimonas sp.]|uniref:hypothetical protein n=1 Tax=Lunatimonas sp. TaxID=2060141 RepID=UPI00263AAB54|nr:hypothetical protein [Lunatimonas sp.]MCC5937148.1 hypothetical protein [Lunatimonas sp.]
MKNRLCFLLFIAFTACVSPADPSYPEEPVIPAPPTPPSPPAQESGRNICVFDLSEKEGEFELTGKWEFVGFQDMHSGRLDNLTCLARIAEFTLTGEDYDNLFQVILNLSQDGKQCSESIYFDAISFSSHLQGCYQVDEEVITFVIPDSGIRTIPSFAGTTFPVQGFEIKFLEGLRSAKHFQMENNKLFLYGEKEEERMVFISLDE